MNDVSNTHAYVMSNPRRLRKAEIIEPNSMWPQKRGTSDLELEEWGISTSSSTLKLAWSSTSKLEYLRHDEDWVPSKIQSDCSKTIRSRIEGQQADSLGLWLLPSQFKFPRLEQKGRNHDISQCWTSKRLICGIRNGERGELLDTE